MAPHHQLFTQVCSPRSIPLHGATGGGRKHGAAAVVQSRLRLSTSRLPRRVRRLLPLFCWCENRTVTRASVRPPRSARPQTILVTDQGNRAGGRDPECVSGKFRNRSGHKCGLHQPRAIDVPRCPPMTNEPERGTSGESSERETTTPSSGPPSRRRSERRMTFYISMESRKANKSTSGKLASTAAAGLPTGQV
jgi:hypothetical protein